VFDFFFFIFFWLIKNPILQKYEILS